MEYNPHFNGLSREEYDESKQIKLFHEHDAQETDARAKLRVSITAGCNQKCSFCFNEGLAVSNKLIDAKDLDFILSVIGPNVRNIRLTGGEPLTHPQIDEIIDLSINYAPTTMTTNGVLLLNHVSSLQKLKDLSISMHSFSQAEFETITKTPGRNLQKVFDGIKKLQDSGYQQININTCLTKNSFDSVDQIISFATDNDLKSVSFIPLLVLNERDRAQFVSPSKLQDVLDSRYTSETITSSRKRYFIEKKRTTIDLVWQYCMVGCGICGGDGFVRVTPDHSFSYCLVKDAEISYCAALKTRDRDGIASAFNMALRSRGNPPSK